MNTPKPMDKETTPAPVFEPFPEPQTMPKGWDFNGLMSTQSLPPVEPAGDEAEA